MSVIVFRLDDEARIRDYCEQKQLGVGIEPIGSDSFAVTGDDDEICLLRMQFDGKWTDPAALG